MSFPANAVEEAMAAAMADPTRFAAFFTALATASVHVPLPQGVPVAGQDAALPTMTIDGSPYVVAFTSVDQLESAGVESAYVTAPARDLARSLPPGVGLAVNPGGIGLPIDADGVIALAGGQTTVPAGSRLRIGEPAQEPTALLQALAGALTRAGTVTEARRAWVQVEERAPGLVLGVRLTGTADEQMPAVLDAVRAAIDVVPVDFSVDVTLLEEGDSLSTWMLDHAPPFFRADDPSV